MPGPAARVGDMTAHGGVIVGPGVPTVLIGGMPASVLGDMHTCPMATPATPPIPHVGGPISSPGAPTVLIGGRPAATIGSICVCVGPPDSIVLGAHTVILGTAGTGAAGAGFAGGAGATGANAGAAAASFDNAESVTKEEHWVEFKFVDKAGLPVSGISYRFKGPGEETSDGVLRLDGTVRRDALAEEGTCEVQLLDVHDAQWSADARKAGQSVELRAAVDGVDDGTTARLLVFRRDIMGTDSQIAEIDTKVQSEQVKAEWTLPSPEETEVLVPQEGAMSNPDEPNRYSRPDYFFEVIVGACRTRSGMLQTSDFVEVAVADEDGRALAGETYVLYLASGEIRKGKLDAGGMLREDDVPPGLNKLRFPDLPDFEADV